MQSSKYVLPAILHTVALFIALNVQSSITPLAGAWVLFFLAGCACSLYSGGYPKFTPVKFLALAWLVALGLSTFIIMPTITSAYAWWILAAMPALALSVRPESVKYYLWGFGAVIALYACGLIVQCYMGVVYTQYNLGDIYAWPLLNPNNAACVLNTALITCAYLVLFRGNISRDFAACLWLLFAAAMITTGSKAGICVGIGGTTAMVMSRYPKTILPFLLSIPASLTAVFYLMPDLIVTFSHSFQDRYPIWEGSYRMIDIPIKDATWPLSDLHKWAGLGIGTFGFYYKQIRLETFTGGFYAHNDLLQMVIELGIPIACMFAVLVIGIAISTRKHNFVAAIVMLGVFLQAMVEFQFYVEAVSILMGLALAVHMQKEPIKPLTLKQLIKEINK